MKPRIYDYGGRGAPVTWAFRLTGLEAAARALAELHREVGELHATILRAEGLPGAATVAGWEASRAVRASWAELDQQHQEER
jgi:hypothetical protein